MGKTQLLTYFFISFFSSSLQSATWYASPSGSSTNGTLAAPWSFYYATTNTNPHLAAGDTVKLLDGTFVCGETNGNYSAGNVHHLRKGGLPGQPITYESLNLWGFSVDGGLMVVSTTPASNIVLRFLRVFSSLSTNRVQTNSAGYTLPPGINADSQGITIEHCLIENTGHPGIGAWKGTRGHTIRGNIIRFTGYDDWIGYSGANRGSGMYLQNATNSNEALIDGNISYYNYTTGMKAYGNTDIWGFTFARNICIDNNEAGVFYHQDNYASTNLQVRTNYLWNNGSGVRIGYPLGNGGHSNAVVIGNYSVDRGYSAYPFYFADGWRGTIFTNNIGITTTDRYVWHLEVLGETSGDVTSHTMFGNTYFGTNTGGFGSGPFFIKEVNKTLAQWKSDTAQDSDATHTYGNPSNLLVRAFRPASDTNFAHVFVANWVSSNSAPVSLSGLFNPGDTIEIFDAQDIPNSYASVVWDGAATLWLDLTRTNRASMNGTFSQRSSQWSGFDPKVRAFVLHKTASSNSDLISARISSSRNFNVNRGY